MKKNFWAGLLLIVISMLALAGINHLDSVKASSEDAEYLYGVVIENFHDEISFIELIVDREVISVPYEKGIDKDVLVKVGLVGDNVVSVERIEKGEKEAVLQLEENSIQDIREENYEFALVTVEGNNFGTDEIGYNYFIEGYNIGDVVLMLVNEYGEMIDSTIYNH